MELNAHEHERSPAGWDAFKVAGEFVELFFSNEHTGTVAVVNSKYLRNRRKFGVPRDEPCRIFQPDDSIPLKHLINTCVSHGHMSALFFPREFSSFWEEFLSLGYYEEESQTVALGNRGCRDPLEYAQMENIEKALGSSLLRGENRLLVFSHDADFLYDVAL